MLRTSEEKRSLLRPGKRTLSQECDDALLWSCDVALEKCSGIYPAQLPWDMLLGLAFLSISCVSAAIVPWLLLRNYGYPLPDMIVRLLPEVEWCAIPFLMLCAWIVAGQVPRRVLREPDAIVIEFLFGRSVVPLNEVLELVVLAHGGKFWDMMERWAVFPFGTTIRFFKGLPSQTGVVCVLLTRHCFWSFIFVLRDPIQFLLDNQRPLDVRARYQTAHKVLLREGETMESPKAAIVPRGHWLRIEKQQGRRVLVKFESSHVRGWMSYISIHGHFLLFKERQHGQQGVVGASELATSYGGIELQDLVVPEGDVVE